MSVDRIDVVEVRVAGADSEVGIMPSVLVGSELVIEGSVSVDVVLGFFRQNNLDSARVTVMVIMLIMLLILIVLEKWYSIS